MLISAYGSTRTISGYGRWRRSTERQATPRRSRPATGLPEGNYASVFYPVAQEFAGIGIENLFKVLIITGSFACALAFWKTSNRYLFAMGREGILPRDPRPDARERTRARSSRRSSSRCSCVMVTSLFATGAAGGGQREAARLSTRASPLTALLQIGTWMPFQGNMLLFPLMALVGLAIIVYFLREGRDGFHWWKTFVAPILGAGAISFAFYLMMKNRAGITFGEYDGLGQGRPVYLARHLPRRLCCSPSSTGSVEGALRGGRQVHPRGGLTALPLIV